MPEFDGRHIWIAPSTSSKIRANRMWYSIEKRDRSRNSFTVFLVILYHYSLLLIHLKNINHSNNTTYLILFDAFYISFKIILFHHSFVVINFAKWFGFFFFFFSIHSYVNVTKFETKPTDHVNYLKLFL